MLAARAEQKNAGQKTRMATSSAPRSAAFAGRAWLRRIAVPLGEGLVVAADLGQVDGFELEGEVHERVCDVSGGFIGDGAPFIDPGVRPVWNY
jgi:hypothetical protein